MFRLLYARLKNPPVSIESDAGLDVWKERKMSCLSGIKLQIGQPLD